MATQNNVSPAKRKYLGSNARIALAKRHYADYVQYVHMGRWKRARHLDLVCEKLESIMEGKTKRLMIFMPPRHGKSMTVTETFPSFYLGKNPESVSSRSATAATLPSNSASGTAIRSRSSVLRCLGIPSPKCRPPKRTGTSTTAWAA